MSSALWQAPSSRSAAIAGGGRLMKSSDSTVISVIFNVCLNAFFAFINLCRATFGTLGFRMTESAVMPNGKGVECWPDLGGWQQECKATNGFSNAGEGRSR